MSDGSSNQVGSILTRLEQARQGEQQGSNAPANQYLRFQVGEANFALPVMVVRGVDRIQTLTYVPGAPSYVLGVCNRRGVVLPCVSLSELLGGPEPEIGRNSRLVLMQDSDVIGLIALLVDRLLDVVSINDTEVEPPMASLQRGAMLHGQTRLASGQIVLLLEPEALLRRISRRTESG